MVPDVTERIIKGPKGTMKNKLIITIIKSYLLTLIKYVPEVARMMSVSFRKKKKTNVNFSASFLYVVRKKSSMSH